MSIFTADLDSVFFRDFAVLISVSTAPLVQAKAIADFSTEEVFADTHAVDISNTLTFTIKTGSLPGLKTKAQLTISDLPGSLISVNELPIPRGRIFVEDVRVSDDGLFQKIRTTAKD